MENKIVIYHSEKGNYSLKINFDGETVWMSQKQIAELFNKDVRTINEHILGIFKDDELNRKSVIRKFRITADDGKKYLTNFYNLDMVISVGYRVNSVQGTKFRIWATNTLKKYLVKGYVINRKRLLEQSKNLESLKTSIDLITSKSKLPQLKEEMESMLELISDYTNSIYLLTKYDERDLKISGLNRNFLFKLTYDEVESFIEKIKTNYTGKLSDLFGQISGNKLKSLIGVIDQTFD
ncbi:MAG: RhuM family protein, partial [Candidatus Margulisiibacteriota bacterium]